MPPSLMYFSDSLIDGGVSVTITQLDGVSDGALLLAEASRYVSQVRQFIAPIDGLQDRDGELEVLAGFCRGDRPYLWIRADPWAGKSALLSSFALSPPPDVTVISFFITDRLADQNTHTAFTNAIFDQLAVLLPGQRMLIAAALVNRDGLRNDLLATAAQREAQQGRRLVLVVDGLDEDTGKPPIVSLLPTRPDPNLRIIAASRHGPDLPIPTRHPMIAARPYLLTSSPFAADIRERAIAELDALLDGPEQHRKLLALITAANGLTSSEINELTDLAPHEIDKLLRGVAGRSFRATSTPTHRAGRADPVYALAHETLQRIAEERLGPRQLTTALDRLHTWADHYRGLGWPVETPDFLLRRYFPVLDRHNDLLRMITAALDTARHDRMRARTGGDAIALDEIRTAQRHICNQPDPDLLSTARLARHRDHLHQSSDSIPIQLLTALSLLGQYDRAEAIAHSYSTPNQQASALASVAAAVAGIDPERAGRIATRAEAIADTITNPYRQADTLAAIAATLAGTDPERAGRIPTRAEAIADTITDPYRQADTLATVAAALAGIDPERAGRIATRAEAIARTLAIPDLQAAALAMVATAVAGIDPERAIRIATRAEAIARTITNPYRQADTLAAVAAAVAGIDPERAEAIADTITSPDLQVEALAAVATAVTGTDPERAGRIATRAEAIARTIANLDLQADTLTAVATTLAGIDPERAEAIADTTTDSDLQAEALAAVATTLAGTDPERAGRIATRAEAIARTITDSYWQAEALTTVATTLAGIDPERAEAITDTITSPDLQAEALAMVAAAVAGTDPERAVRIATRAEAIARTITDPYRQARPLTTVATTLAGIDPERAEAITDTITDPYRQADTLAMVAAAVAGTDPERAVRIATRAEAIADTIANLDRQVDTLTTVATTLAGIDPERAGRIATRAEAIARTITTPYRQAEAFTTVATTLAGIDPERAVAIADTITDLDLQADALAAIATTLAGIDPERAEAITDTITDPYRQADTLAAIATTLAGTDPERAVRIATRAEAITRTITDPYQQARALTAIATTVVNGQHALDVSTSSKWPQHMASSKDLLALAWSISRWDLPVSALSTVDAPTLRALVSDLIEEH